MLHWMADNLAEEKGEDAVAPPLTKAEVILGSDEISSGPSWGQYLI